MNSARVLMVPVGLAAWADQSRLASRPAAMASARAAMHAAVRTAAAATSSPRRRFRITVPRLDGLLRHPVRLTAASMAAATALVVAVGWDAGPGSPLHSIQLARQDASLVLAGGTQAVDLRLQYAEARLRDAADGSDSRDNLEEAASLLAAARQGLPANHADPLWLRWSRDEAALGALLAGPASPGRDSGSSSHGRDNGNPAPSGGGDQRGGDGGSGSGGGNDRAGSSAGGAPSPSADDHGGGSGSGKQAAPVAPSAASDGGGGGSGKGGGSPTPNPSASPDDNGGGGKGT
jgi:hypothetical protein